MLSGRFTRRGSPAITGELRIPNLGVAGEVVFLIDTGASDVVLMPRDVKNLGIPIDELGKPVEIEGTTGTGKAFRKTGFIVFRSKTHEYIFITDLLIIEPTEEDDKKSEVDKEGRHRLPRPSLLGRDVVNRWCFLYDHRAGTLDIDPASWYRLESITPRLAD